MKLNFIESDVKQIPVILEMMEDFNSIYGISFKKETREQNLIEFICKKSLGRLWTINLDKDSIGNVVLSFGFSFEFAGKEFRAQGIGTITMRFGEPGEKSFR